MIIAVGWATLSFAQSTDSIPLLDSYDLDDLVVSSQKARKAVEVNADGSLRLSADLPSEQPSFMGSGDALFLLRSLPDISTAGDLRAAMNVRGGSTGQNLFLVDGVRVISPLHMLGMYSAFNPAYYRSYTFSPSAMRATEANASSGMFRAHSGENPDSVFEGKASVGLIESHGAFRIPLRKGRSSLSIGIRQSYLNLLFPRILTLGESVLKYGFTDANLGFKASLGDASLLSASFFANRDALSLRNDISREKEGSFSWWNLAAGLSLRHRAWVWQLAYSRVSNGFRLNEGGREIDLPSWFSQLYAKADFEWRDFRFEGDINRRFSSGQQNRAGSDGNISDPSSQSYEFNLGAHWERSFFSRLNLGAGLRATLYHSGRFNTAVLQPRLSAAWEFSPDLALRFSYGRFVRFDRQIEESDVGLPVDFWVCAGQSIKPDDVHALSLGLGGYFSPLAVSFSIEGYYKAFVNVLEFDGSVLDFISPSYSPLGSLISGRGFAAGLSLSLMRQIGKVRGRVSYNLGVARARFSKYGPDYFPLLHDRPHDLNVNLSYSPVSPLTVALSFVYASGSPYTQARLGYMIGENLILEYFPHNSSRLPDYKRLDLSVNWDFPPAGRVRQSLNLSIYNMAAFHNVLFRYMRYSLDQGITQKESVMKAVIPSLTYSIEF